MSDDKFFAHMHSPAPLTPEAQKERPREPMGMLDLEEPPDVYGVDEVTVLARDPFTLFVYWEVTQGGRSAARASLGGDDGALVLRLYVVGVGAHPGITSPEAQVIDHPLDWDHGRRYLGTPRTGVWVAAAVGLLTGDGRFAPISHAPRIKVPYAEPGSDGPVEWMEAEPARSRGPKLERPAVLQRGPARVVKGAGAGMAGASRWEQGVWNAGTSSRVPAPTSGPLSGEDMPSSPWRWQKEKK